MRAPLTAKKLVRRTDGAAAGIYAPRVRFLYMYLGFGRNFLLVLHLVFISDDVNANARDNFRKVSMPSWRYGRENEDAATYLLRKVLRLRP